MIITPRNCHDDIQTRGSTWEYLLKDISGAANATFLATRSYELAFSNFHDMRWFNAYRHSPTYGIITVYLLRIYLQNRKGLRMSLCNALQPMRLTMQRSDA